MVAGARTVSGFPLLANDPHLTFRAPSIWNLVHLESPDGSVIGASLPGVTPVQLSSSATAASGSAPPSHRSSVAAVSSGYVCGRRVCAHKTHRGMPPTTLV